MRGLRMTLLDPLLTNMKDTLYFIIGLALFLLLLGLVGSIEVADKIAGGLHL